jgi:signal transduction histidine kinase
VGEGHLQQLAGKATRFAIGVVFAGGLVLLGLNFVIANYLNVSTGVAIGTGVAVLVVVSMACGWLITKKLLEPLGVLAQAIQHISPSEKLVAAPNMDELRLGRELITSLARQVYQFASAPAAQPAEASQLNLTSLVPLPLIGLDAGGKIVFANARAEQYCAGGKPLAGQSLPAALDLGYGDSPSVQDWLATIASDKITGEKSWERVRLNIREAEPKYFDMSASYSRHHPSGIETLLALFDHTERYSEDDKSISFISLAVHVLRTPLSALRGFIEVFEEELSGKVSGEMEGFIQKMHASAESLTAFVTNILNVARVEQGQLALNLQEEDWTQLLKGTVNEMRLRAAAHGKSVELAIAPGLPPVAADRVTIAEVIVNLMDNAIKYSPDDAKTIWVKSYLTKDGLVETIVQDQGIGIPGSVMPHLFEKFYRNHRSRASIGGTGLGLYLSRAIIGAHEGNIWVRANAQRGSTFGFTLLPYAQLADARKSSDNKEIIRSSHGWIKNHSLSRR